MTVCVRAKNASKIVVNRADMVGSERKRNTTIAAQFNDFQSTSNIKWCLKVPQVFGV